MKKGIAASKGYAIGKSIFTRTRRNSNNRCEVSNVEAEKEVLTKGFRASKSSINCYLENKALAEIGEHEAQVFEAHLTLLDDPEFTGGMLLEIESNSINAMKSS